jgi:hypothetical protein
LAIRATLSRDALARIATSCKPISWASIGGPCGVGVGVGVGEDMLGSVWWRVPILGHDLDNIEPKWKRMRGACDYYDEL